MENIDLALLNVMTSGEISGRDENFHSDAKAEGGFAEVLAGHDEKVEVDSENNRITPPKQKEKQTENVEPVERDRIATDDSEDDDVEIEGENLFQEVPFKEASSEKKSLSEELSQDRQPGFSDLLGKSGNLPQQNDLLAGIQGGDDEVQVLFMADSVAGENLEAEGATVTDNFILKDGEFSKDNGILTSINPVASKTEAGNRAGKADVLTQKSGTSSVSSDAGLKLVDGMKSAEANESAENFIDVENEQISSKDNQEPVIAAADFVDLKVEGESNRQIKNGLELFLDGPKSLKFSIITNHNNNIKSVY